MRVETIISRYPHRFQTLNISITSAACTAPTSRSGGTYENVKRRRKKRRQKSATMQRPTNGKMLTRWKREQQTKDEAEEKRTKEWRRRRRKKNYEQKNIFCRSSVFPLSLPFSLLSLLLSSRLVPLMFYISMKLLCKWNALFSFVHFILSSFPVTNFSVQVSSSLRCNTPSSPLTQHQRTLPHCRLSVVVPISQRSSKVLY